MSITQSDYQVDINNGNQSYSKSESTEVSDNDLSQNSEMPIEVTDQVDQSGDLLSGGNGVNIDWDANSYNGQWLDSVGQDSIADFNVIGGNGDMMNIAGYDDFATIPEGLDCQVKLGLSSDGGDNFDCTLTSNDSGNFSFESELTDNSSVAANSF